MVMCCVEKMGATGLRSSQTRARAGTGLGPRLSQTRGTQRQFVSFQRTAW